MNNPIHTQNLGKKFRHVEALRDLNLTVPEGAVYALVGPNGAGKTTLVKVLMNIFAATRGRAEVLGIDSTRLRGRRFQSIGYVSENQELPEWMRLDLLFSYLRPFYPSWDRKLENDLVHQFDLPLNRKIRNLSRGMRMKAALVGALAYHPKLILLDEPFTGLDPLVRDELIQGLLERAEESTIFISSHDLAEIESFVSHIGYLEDGQLRLSEEFTALVDRFREVQLTFEVVPPVPSTVPDTWMQLSTSDAVVRFVESRYDAERTISQVRGVLGVARDVLFTPMSLRSIFLALAKSGREAVEKTE